MENTDEEPTTGCFLHAVKWHSQCLANNRRSVEGKGTGMKYDSVENAPTIPASSVGRGQLLGKEKTVSLLGYILAQTNNVLLEATNLYKPTNREEEGGGGNL